MFIVSIVLVLALGSIYCITENNKRIEKEEKERQYQYRVFKTEILTELGLSTLDLFSYFDTNVTVKSRQALENYDDIKFFRENNKMLEKVEKIIEKKNNVANILIIFITLNLNKKLMKL